MLTCSIFPFSYFDEPEQTQNDLGTSTLLNPCSYTQRKEWSLKRVNTVLQHYCTLMLIIVQRTKVQLQSVQWSWPWVVTEEGEAAAVGDRFCESCAVGPVCPLASPPSLPQLNWHWVFRQCACWLCSNQNSWKVTVERVQRQRSEPERIRSSVVTGWPPGDIRDECPVSSRQTAC